MEHWGIELAIVIVVSIVGWLLAQKDKAQQDQLNDIKVEQAVLNTKHDHDVLALNAMQLKVAETYHPKVEVNDKFKSLEAAMAKGFDDLKADIKQMFAGLK